MSQIGMLSVVEAPDILYNQVKREDNEKSDNILYNQLRKRIMMLIVDTSENISENSDDDVSDKQRHDHNGGGKCTVEMRSQV